MALILTESLKLKLKSPVGLLIEGDVESVIERLIPMIQDKRIV